jgi:Xaa-Pro aminopeptidase
MTATARALQDRLQNLKVDALLFNTSEDVTSFNLTYVTGFSGSDGAALIGERELHFFTDGRYKSQVSGEITGFTVHVVRRKLESIVRAVKRNRVRRLGIEAARTTYAFVTALQRRLPSTEVLALDRRFLEDLRICKGTEETAKVARAAEIASSCCQAIVDGGLRGKRESHVAAQLEALFKENGSQGFAFETIVASGERSVLPHGSATDKVIAPQDLVVIDYGCRFAGYNSDETVTCSVGEPQEDQQRIFRAVRDAHDRAIDALKPGMEAREVDRIARRSIEKAGFGKYFLHGLGHGVGLEVHEAPSVSPYGKRALEEGMIFTIEPGVYIEGIGGVRLESLIAMKRTGPEILSKMPKDLIRVD